MNGRNGAQADVLDAVPVKVEGHHTSVRKRRPKGSIDHRELGDHSLLKTCLLAVSHESKELSAGSHKEVRVSVHLKISDQEVIRTRVQRKGFFHAELARPCPTDERELS